MQATCDTKALYFVLTSVLYPVAVCHFRLNMEYGGVLVAELLFANDSSK